MFFLEDCAQRWPECAGMDCLHCTRCPDGFIQLNVTERVAHGECVEYHDRIREQCVDLMVKVSEKYVVPDWCTGVRNGVNLRCGDGVLPDVGCVCLVLSP